MTSIGRGAVPSARTDVDEILRGPALRFSRREMQLLHAVCTPDHKMHKEMARDAGMSEGVAKVYFRTIYRKLGWPYGSSRMLVLWAMAHREMLNIELPTAASFHTGPV